MIKLQGKTINGFYKRNDSGQQSGRECASEDSVELLRSEDVLFLS